jgi:hypothetical protein
VSLQSFQDFADWFGAELMSDREMVPNQPECTCGNIRRISKHLASCPFQLAATLGAVQLVLDDARQEPPDFSMRTALMYLGTAYADRKGYDDTWRPVIPGSEAEKVAIGRRTRRSGP